MARSLNQVTLMGNLTRDPELRQTPTGQNVTSFSLALNRATKTPAANGKKPLITSIRLLGAASRARSAVLEQRPPLPGPGPPAVPLLGAGRPEAQQSGSTGQRRDFPR